MSISMHVVGFKLADEHWKKMKAAWDACAAVGIEPPDEVSDFFDGEDPGDAPGKEVEIEDNGAKVWKADMQKGYEVDITKLPEGVRFVRFYCSW